MSNDVFPELPGLSWSVFKRPVFSTGVQTAVSLAELRTSYTATPIYETRLTYEILRDDTANDELEELGGFILAHYGRFDSFLYRDPTDYNVSSQILGTGNGVNADFQLVRTFGTFTEKVANANVVTSVTVNNVPTANYTISSTGLITFNTPPPNNEVVRATFTYYFRARFKSDTSEWENFMHQLWALQSLEMVTNLGTKL